MLPQKLIEIIEESEYTINYDCDSNFIDFGKYSTAGRDFHIEINAGYNIDCLAQNIWDYYLTFDVSEETYLWLDNTGHGKNGAPYDMKDVYEDTQECRQFIVELYNIITDYMNKTHNYAYSD